jgi:hypothetical protein
LGSVSDSALLSFAAEYHLVVLTHDQKTLLPEAYGRLKVGEAMPGVVYIPWSLSVGEAIGALELLDSCLREDEWESSVYRLPI